MSAQRPEIKILANRETAFASESITHINSRYLARFAREAAYK